MKIPAITGMIRRRILLNYRVSPEVVAEILPSPFRPKLVDGYSIAGICLIRLEEIRAKKFPAILGISSENSAHRIAVEWEDKNGEQREGVFVPRRDTNSRLNALAGGRVFPGVHHLSRFEIEDHEGTVVVKVIAKDFEKPLVDLEVSESDNFPDGSVFKSLDETSAFFERGCIGYSSRPNSPKLDGLRLNVDEWRVSALEIKHARSAYFDDLALFPAESNTLDHALLMRGIPHDWQSEPQM